MEFAQLLLEMLQFVSRMCLASDVNILLDLSLAVHWLDDLWPLPSGGCEWFWCGVHRQMMFVSVVSCPRSLLLGWCSVLQTVAWNKDIKHIVVPSSSVSYHSCVSLPKWCCCMSFTYFVCSGWSDHILIAAASLPAWTCYPDTDLIPRYRCSAHPSGLKDIRGCSVGLLFPENVISLTFKVI